MIPKNYFPIDTKSEDSKVIKDVSENFERAFIISIKF